MGTQHPHEYEDEAAADISMEPVKLRVLIEMSQSISLEYQVAATEVASCLSNVLFCYVFV